MNQPANLMLRMEYALDVYEAVSEYERMRKRGGEQWFNWQKENGERFLFVSNLAKES